jgi:hypothetical protein
MKDRSNWPVRKMTLAQAREFDDDLIHLTADERVAMMWQLALDGWALKGEPVEPRLPRHVDRVIRREG